MGELAQGRALADNTESIAVTLIIEVSPITPTSFKLSLQVLREREKEKALFFFFLAAQQAFT